jgi:hypothetical protein
VFPFTPRASDDPAELAKVPCYRVPRALYEKCPELDSQLVADLEFMASQEGALLASLPKLELTGCTCLLLSLANLRSATGAASAVTKTDHARFLADQFAKV